jgi:3-isopropylmalate/(R)-2-methylmalate dehydratase small subunit
VTTDLDESIFGFHTDGQKEDIPFSISEFDRALIEAGGWIEYAEAKY